MNVRRRSLTQQLVVLQICVVMLTVGIAGSLLIAEQAGTLVWANDEARRLLQLPPGKAGTPVSELLAGTDLVGLVELGRYEEAVRLGTRDSLVALLPGKTAIAVERGVELRLSSDTAATAAHLPVEQLLRERF